MKDKNAVIGAVIAILLGVIMIFRVSVAKFSFDKTVKDAHKTSEGYDQLFINMVNRLEEVLATRASFGYPGGKDPMTGRERIVAKQPTRPAAGKPGQVTKRAVDDLKLSATIFDDVQRRYSAIVMLGERSLTLDVGDVVRDRKVVKIDAEAIIFEGPAEFVMYDINGNTKSRPK